MMYEDYTYLDITVADGIATVLNNDPDHGNVFTPDAHREWSRVYDDLALDPRVQCVIIGGHGKHFSAGPTQDYMNALVSDPDARARGFHETERIVYSPLTFDKPVVSAISGEVLGGATTYALLADIIIADRTAVFADRHIAAGMVPGDGGVLTWVTYAGLLQAKKYLLLGDPVPADEAARIGLVTEVVDEGMALPRAREYAQRLASAPPDAMRNGKRALNQWLRLLAPAVFDQSHALEAASMLNSEFTAWVRSLNETASSSPRSSDD
jgi:enoyl-CoA hydratase